MGLHFKIANFIDLVNFECQNVAKVGILVLCRVCEKL